jgi:hypothetical protein
VSRRGRLLACALAGAAVGSAPAAAVGGQRDELRAAAAAVRSLEAKVELMELSASRYADWTACIRGVPVSEYGDPDGRFGYLYDEQDGSGRTRRPALAVDRRRSRRPDYLFLDFARSGVCRSNPPRPGGTAEPASAARGSRARANRPVTLSGLERRVVRLKRSVKRLTAVAKRFDRWESCVSQVPVTEYGDPGGASGYLFGRVGTAAFSYRPALAVDRSDWDDPDYMLLAFVGSNRPGGNCRSEPGEGID